nr:response regulator [Desulfobulbaceae bacterium]
MDIQMPELDGFQATRQLRELENKAGGKQLPIIAMTAHAFQQDMDNCLKEGMNDYISKPINPDKLYALIERYCWA